MDLPGLSLFQGGESIQINTNDNQCEEEEAIADQKRRNEELQEELQNAFDDLIEDDDFSVDTSRCLESQFRNGHVENGMHNFVQNGHMYDHLPRLHQSPLQSPVDGINVEIEKLHKIIESKNREIDNISQIVLDERKKNDELTKCLALSEAEKDRAIMTRKQTHELLVESKAKFSDLEDCCSKLKNKIKTLENTNNDMVAELEKSKNLLSDAQHKYYMVEKNVGLTHERSTDQVVKQLKERHSAQMEVIQQQLDSFRNKYEDKEAEYKTLETRYTELQKSREALLIEKSETINQLANSLEESQKKCQQLMMKEDYSQENIRLQRVINAFEKQAEGMRRTINDLESQLQETTNELKVLESLVCENGEDISENLRRLSFEKDGLIGSTPLSSKDRFCRLKNELYRSVAGQKSKRDEIRRLQEQLNLKIEEIKKVKDEENKALVQMNTYKESNTRLENRLRILETEIYELKTHGLNDVEKSVIVEKDHELSKLEQKNCLLELELKNIQKEYENAKSLAGTLKQEVEDLRQKIKSSEVGENDLKKVNSSLKNLNVDFEELKQEHESLKNKHNLQLKENSALEESLNCLKLDLEKYKFLLNDAQTECDRVKNLYAEISNAKDNLSKQLAEIKAKDLNKELYVQKEKCAILERSLQLAEMKCSELEKSAQAHRQNYEKGLEQQRQKFENEKEELLKSMKNTSNECVKCIDHIAEVTKFEIQNLKLQDQCTTYAREVNDLRLELSDTKHTILDLNEKISLKEQRDNLIDELKEKARQFEEYIKNQSSSKETLDSASSKRTSRDQSVETSPELEYNYTRRKVESKVRDEMAKIFAVEIKSIETSFKEKLKDLENQHSALSVDKQRLKYELQLRQNEVEVLKHAILAEREKMQEILKKKEAEFNQMREKHTTLLEKCRNELKVKQNQVQRILKELEERTSQIEAERESMKVVTKHWDDERKTHSLRVDELKQELTERIKEHEKAIEQLQAKYLSAKKTAANYKRYSEDKEKHMLQEYDRIKSGYENSIAKIENKMKDIIQKQNKEMKDKINEVEAMYEAKLASLQKSNDKGK